MSNQQQQKRKFHTFAAGWIKQTTKGENYISAKVGNPKQKIDVYVSENGEEPRKVDYFAVYFENKDPNFVPKDPTRLPPDVRFTFTTEE